jgi:hypothetical protein
VSPNGSDFDPATLHDWPQVREELAARAKGWAATPNQRANTRMEPIAYNYGFSETELNRIAGIVRKHEAELSKAWHDYFKRGNGNGSRQERSGH